MSDSDRIRLAYAAESTYATPPGSAVMKAVRITGESLAQATQTTPSQEIREDRQNADVVRTQISAGGDINVELSYGSFDDFLAAVLQSAGWSSAVTTGSGTMSISSNVITGTGLFTNFVVGQWVKLTTGFAAANLGKVGKVSAKTDDTCTLVGVTLADESSGSGKTVVMGEQIVNGTTLTTYQLERKYGDISNTFARYHGMAINGMNLTVPSDGIITGSFSWLGQKESSETAELDADATVPLQGVDSDVMASVDDVVSIIENNAVYDATQFTLSLVNNLRLRYQIGSVGPISIGSGNIGLTGTLNAFFTSAAVMAKYLAFSKTSLAISIGDGEGNSYVIEMPEIKFTDGKRVAGGQNSDILAEMTWMAKRDPSEGITVRITRFAA